MKKGSFIFGTILVVILILTIATFGIVFYFSANKNQQTYIENNSNEYQITKYDALVVIGENNVLNVTENLDVHFSVQSHGIFRAIPTTSTIFMPDQNGKIIQKKYPLKFNVVNVSEQFKTFTDDGIFYIQIGSSNQYAPDNSSYTINYTVDLGKDRIGEFDQFYYNVIGNLTDTTVDNVNIAVKFPKSVNQHGTSTAGAYVGAYGSNKEVGLIWAEENTLLKLSHQHLEVGEGITVRVVLPNGYFSPNFAGWFVIINLVLLIAFAAFAIYLFKKYSTKKMVVPVVQFSVDKKFTSADVGYIMDRKVDNKDIASLILYWAQHGNLRIVEKTTKKNKKLTYLQKINDLPDKAKPYEKTFFKALFQNDVANENGEFPLHEIKDLGPNTQPVMSDVKNSVGFTNMPLFKGSGLSARGWLIFLAGVMFAVVGIAINLQTASTLKAVLFGLCGVLIMLVLQIMAKNRDFTHFNPTRNKVFGWIGIAISFALVVWLLLSSFDIYVDFCLTSLWVLVEIVLVFYVVYNFNIRTDEGVEELGDIVGLKNFIETAEKDRLEMLVKDDPSAFYNVLPYAYVLGVYEKWCKKFEQLAISAPDWYVGDNNTVFNSLLVFHLMDSSCNTLLSSIHTAQMAKLAEGAKDIGSSIGGSIGGGIGGGGFSGGGMGGGGVGRW